MGWTELAQEGYAAGLGVSGVDASAYAKNQTCMIGTWSLAAILTANRRQVWNTIQKQQ
jgi:hypothetical protein